MPKKKQNKEEPEEKEPENFLELPDWVDEDRIYNYITVAKYVGFDKREKTFKAWIEDGQLKYKIDHSLCLPPDTPMSSQCFQSLLNERKLPDISFRSLFEELKEKQSQFVYADDIHHTNTALKSMASFFLEVFSTVPYTDIFSPEFGSGKTTLMEVAVLASYLGLIYTNATGPTIYRIMKDVRVTLGVDEIDNLFRKPADNPDILAVINSSNIKGIKVPRINKDTGKIDYYDAFGPKWFTRVGPMPLSMNSRSDPVPMTECRGRKDLKKYPKADDFQDLRDKAYLLRWTRMDEVNETYNDLINQRILKDRNLDIYLPILTIAKLTGEDVYNQVLTYAENQWLKNSMKSKDIYKETLTRILWENKSFRNEVKVTDIRNEYNNRLEIMGLLGKGKDGSYNKYTSKTVIKLLNELRFERSAKMAQNNVHYDINSKILEDNALMYNIISGEVSEVDTSKPNRKSSSLVPLLIQNKEKSEVSEVSEVHGKERRAIDLEFPSRENEGIPPQPNLPNQPNRSHDNYLSMISNFMDNNNGNSFSIKDIHDLFQDPDKDKIAEILDTFLLNGIIFSPKPNHFRVLT